MRKAGPAGPLVLGSHVVPEIDGGDRAAVVLVEQDVEPVRQRVLGEPDVHRTTVNGMVVAL